MKALITLLIIGTSSVALAQPAIVDHRNDYSFEERDHRFDERDHDRRPDLDRGYARAFGYRMRPVTLASNVSLMRQRNRDQRPLLVDVDSRMGSFKTLRIDHVEGRAYINDIVLVLANGRTTTIDVNQMLSYRSPSITIDLNNRAITGIYFYGSTERGRASFNVIGLRR